MRHEDEMRQAGVDADVDAHVRPFRCFDRRVKLINDGGKWQ